jgi:3-oxoacyl-[acyl-carrier protein] reductase
MMKVVLPFIKFFQPKKKMHNQRYAVILGASGEIGQAICRNLAALGWSLYLHYNENKSEVENLQATLSKQFPGLTFIIVQADFSGSDGAKVLAEQLAEVHAVIVANGQPMYKLLSETTTSDMDALWKVHVQNPAHFIGLVSSKLRLSKLSYIVFIGSIWGNTGAAGEVMYSAVKGAQHAFVKAYAKEAAYSGVRVNAVAPGWIETRMNDSIPEDERQMIVDEIPLMKVGTPKNVADTVEFLLSGKADYMTGEIVKVNGGWYI